MFGRRSVSDKKSFLYPGPDGPERTDPKSSKYFTSTGLIVPARKDTAQILNNSGHNEKIFLEIIEQSKSTNININYKRISDKINQDL